MAADRPGFVANSRSVPGVALVTNIPVLFILAWQNSLLNIVRCA